MVNGMEIVIRLLAVCSMLPTPRVLHFRVELGIDIGKPDTNTVIFSKQFLVITGFVPVA